MLRTEALQAARLASESWVSHNLAKGSPSTRSRQESLPSLKNKVGEKYQYDLGVCGPVLKPYPCHLLAMYIGPQTSVLMSESTQHNSTYLEGLVSIRGAWHIVAASREFFSTSLLSRLVQECCSHLVSATANSRCSSQESPMKQDKS